MRTALFPGSFDPITRGHESIIQRALPLFDKIVVALGVNSNKNYMFSLEQRMEWIANTFRFESKVEVAHYEGLTVNFCRKVNATFIIRGIRNAEDFQFESAIAQMNRELAPDVDTILLVTSPELTPISSSIVRDIIKNGGDASKFLPAAVDVNSDF